MRRRRNGPDLKRCRNALQMEVLPDQGSGVCRQQSFWPADEGDAPALDFLVPRRWLVNTVNTFPPRTNVYPSDLMSPCPNWESSQNMVRHSECRFYARFSRHQTQPQETCEFLPWLLMKLYLVYG